jgi:predicted PurR-regulated permease PerM
MPKSLQGLLKSGAGRKMILLGVIIAAIYILLPVLDIFLFTFLFIFLVNGAQKFLRKKIKFLQRVPEAWLAFGIYLLGAFGVIAMVYIYIPRMTSQIYFISQIVHELEEGSLLQHLGEPFVSFIDDSDIFYLIQNSSVYIFETAGAISAIAIEATLAVVLSLFFFAERQHLHIFSQKLEKSLFGGAYEEICSYGRMFTNSFGKVIETQVVIAVVNTSITCLGLYLLRFPSLFALALFVFLLSMIPVAGAIISAIPLVMLGLVVGGIKTAILVVLLIAIVHSIEAYYLNPRLLSHKTELPAFLVFLILITGEHLLGVWGLIVGVPFFVFFLELFECGSNEMPIESQLPLIIEKTDDC